MEPQERALSSLDDPIALSRGAEAVTRAGSPRHQGSGSGHPGVLLRRYQHLAFIGDGISALLAGVLALIYRFGTTPTPIYLLIALAMPIAWLAVVAAQRGYEQRFLGTGPEEYRKIADAGLLLFTSIAVVSYAVRGEIARGYVFIAVPLTILATLLVRRQLRTWIYRLRARGQALQRVLVVGRADAVVSVIEKLDHEPQ